MVIPTIDDSIYGVSIIKKQTNQVSLHIISVFQEFDNNILLSKDYKSSVNKGTILEKADEQFPFANPLITDSALKVFEFLIETNKFAQRKNN